MKINSMVLRSKALNVMVGLSILCGFSATASAVWLCPIRAIDGVQCTRLTAPGTGSNDGYYLTIANIEIVPGGNRECDDSIGQRFTDAAYVERCVGCGHAGTYLPDNALEATLDLNRSLAIANFSTSPAGNIIWGLGHIEVPLNQSSQVTVNYMYGQISQEHVRVTLNCRAIDGEMVALWQL